MSNRKLKSKLDARKKLAATFKYEIPYAKYHPAFKLGRWDGNISLFGIGGNGYLSQLETILDILLKMGIDIDDIDDQRNPINLIFNKVTETKTTMAMFDSRKANIVKGTPYYQFNFIDSQSGEEYEFNCHKQTHDTCVRLNLYPDILQKFFKT